MPQAILPIWDMDLTIAEMDTPARPRHRGFTLSDKPELLGLPELPEPYFAPMWDLFNDSGAVVNFHIGAGPAQGGDGDDPLRPLHRDRPGGVRQRAEGIRRSVLALVRSPASPRGRCVTDVHEQRANRRQPLHERPVRPLPEPQASCRPSAASAGCRSCSSRSSSSSTRWSPTRKRPHFRSGDRREYFQRPHLRDVLVRVAVGPEADRGHRRQQRPGRDRRARTRRASSPGPASTSPRSSVASTNTPAGGCSTTTRPSSTGSRTGPSDATLVPQPPVPTLPGTVPGGPDPRGPGLCFRSTSQFHLETVPSRDSSISSGDLRR